jgi:acetyltransferase-like isoleucine patch superfamily enzyme
MPIERTVLGKAEFIDSDLTPELLKICNVAVWHPELVNIYDSVIGEGTKIACFVEIGGATIGKDCKIEAFAFIPPGTIIEDHVFIGPHVTICNDKYPNLLQKDWQPKPVVIKRGARVGANATILPGVTIGEEALIGAGAVVTHDVPAKGVVYGHAGVAMSQRPGFPLDSAKAT